MLYVLMIKWSHLRPDYMLFSTFEKLDQFMKSNFEETSPLEMEIYWGKTEVDFGKLTTFNRYMW